MSHDASDPLDLARLAALAEAALDAARQAGADAAEAVALARVASSTTLRLGVVEEAESAEATDLGLRVFVGARVAHVGLGQRADLAAAAERAVAMARAAPPDETQSLAEPPHLATPDDADRLEIDDGVMPAMASLTERAHALERAMLAVPGVTNSDGVRAFAVRAARVMAATNGFRGGYRTSVHGHGGGAIAGEGTRMERDSHHSTRRHLADLADEAAVGAAAGHRAVRRLGAEALTTRTATVIFEPMRVSSGFLGHLLSAVNGAAVARGSSLLAGRLGDQVMAPGITVTDDPRLRRGLASRPFDGEGLAGTALDIVSDGVLAAYLLDLASARRLGLTANARATRGTGAPSPASTNVAVRGGRGDLRSLMREANRGLLVTDLIGQGVNIVNGTYSRGAAGYWFENGEIVHPVSEVTIAGTLGDMFARARFGDDAPGLYAVDAPTIAIEGLTVGGR